MPTYVCLYDGHDPLNRGSPVWIGTLTQFWAQNQLEDDEIMRIQTDLAVDGETYIGGGAEAEFTLVRR